MLYFGWVCIKSICPNLEICKLIVVSGYLHWTWLEHQITLSLSHTSYSGAKRMLVSDAAWWGALQKHSRVKMGDDRQCISSVLSPVIFFFRKLSFCFHHDVHLLHYFLLRSMWLCQWLSIYIWRLDPLHNPWEQLCPNKSRKNAVSSVNNHLHQQKKAQASTRDHFFQNTGSPFDQDPFCQVFYIVEVRVMTPQILSIQVWLQLCDL